MNAAVTAAANHNASVESRFFKVLFKMNAPM